MVAHRGKHSVHVTVLRVHGIAGTQGYRCCLEMNNIMPVCLLVIAHRAAPLHEAQMHFYSYLRSGLLAGTARGEAQL